MLSQNKKGLEFNFAWLFAIIVGAIIIFLAIYFASKYVKTENYQGATVTAKQLTILFEPLETGLASGLNQPTVNMREETKLYMGCSDYGNFGRQDIRVASSGFGNKEEIGEPIRVINKYIFSENIVKGSKFYFFSMPFNMPWKVSELIIMSTENYCFMNAPDAVKEQISLLNIQNIKFDNCTGKRVCFGAGNCDIQVVGTCSDNCGNLGEYDSGYIIKNNSNIYYSGNLLYAGIFSSKEIYECNVRRLMKRLSQQADLLRDELSLLACQNSAELSSLINLKITNSTGLVFIRPISNDIDTQNKNSLCKLW